MGAGTGNQAKLVLQVNETNKRLYRCMHHLSCFRLILSILQHCFKLFAPTTLGKGNNYINLRFSLV